MGGGPVLAQPPRQSVQKQEQEKKSQNLDTSSRVGENHDEERKFNATLKGERFNVSAEKSDKIASGLSSKEKKSLTEKLGKLNEEQAESFGKLINSAENPLETLKTLLNKEHSSESFIKELEKLVKIEKEEKQKREREEAARIQQERNSRLTRQELKEYQNLVEKINRRLTTDEARESFANIQKKWNGQTIESLKLMQELAKLSDPNTLHRSLRPQHQAIFTDVLKTLSDPSKMNQGIYATCVPSSYVNDAIHDGMAVRLLEITNKQLAKASCGALRSTENGTYLHNALNSDMRGGIMVAALMAETHFDFDKNGQTVHAGRTYTGVQNTGVARIHKAIYGQEALVVPNEELRKLSPDELQKLIKANDGIVAKLRWDNGGEHTFHMVRIVGVVNHNGRTIIQFENPQSEKFLKENNKAKISGMNYEEFMERVDFMVVNDTAGLDINAITGDELEDNIDEKQSPGNQSPRSSVSLSDSSYLADSELPSQSLADSIVRISKGYYTPEELNIIEKSADGVGIGEIRSIK